MTSGTPPAEIQIGVELVRELLRAQHPELAEETIAPFSEGWDNCIFRLGADRLVRMPRRAAAAALVENEQACLPAIAARLGVPVPAPLAGGRPGCGYPWSWSVVPMIEGDPVAVSGLASGGGQVLADLLRRLHVAADETAPVNPARGVPLGDRREATEARMARLASETSAMTPAIRDAWAAGLGAGRAFERAWLHGDLHPHNVLQVDGRISGVIDWGDVCGGDPASDLASFWMLIDCPEERRSGLAEYGADPDLVARARGWAVFYGVILLDTGRIDNPLYARIGAAILQRIEAEH